MTMAELREKRKKYVGIKIEIAELTERIKDLEQRNFVTDVVKGSNAEYPYTEHPVKIAGKGMDKESKMLAQREKEIKEERARLEKKLQDTVSFLDCIDNRMIKRAVELKVIDGLSWQQIVNRFGNVLTEAALLMRTKRELEKI
ncbi:MAG: hypothetical protein U0I48_01255 [Acutalibacteraceae bacterium]|nr:hypothetical protein [Acutalibacteraceae bacterium]